MSQKMKRLTIALPEDVWDRLDAEAREKDNVGAGTYLARLVVNRDQRNNTKFPETPVSARADTPTSIQQKGTT